MAWANLPRKTNDFLAKITYVETGGRAKKISDLCVEILDLGGCILRPQGMSSEVYAQQIKD